MIDVFCFNFRWFLFITSPSKSYFKSPMFLRNISAESPSPPNVAPESPSPLKSESSQRPFRWLRWCSDTHFRVMARWVQVQALPVALNGWVVRFPPRRWVEWYRISQELDGWMDGLQGDGWGGYGHVDSILLTNYLAPGYVYRMLFLEDGLLPSYIPW